MKKLGNVTLVVSLPVFSPIPPKLSETSLAAGLKGVASKLISPELDPLLPKEEIATNEGRVTFVVSLTDPLLCSIVSTGTKLGKVTLVVVSEKVSETSSAKNVVKLD